MHEMLKMNAKLKTSLVIGIAKLLNFCGYIRLRPPFCATSLPNLYRQTYNLSIFSGYLADILAKMH